MKPTAKLVLMCALGAVLGAESAEAAVTCVENKATGKFEEKANSRTRKVTGECDAQVSMAMVSSLDELEDAAKAGGTRVIDGVIVTNAAQPFDAAPAKHEASAVQAPGDAQRAAPKWEPLPVRGEAAPMAKSPATAVAKGSDVVPAKPAAAPAAISPVAAPATFVTKVAASVAPAPTWTISVADKTVRAVLERWSKTAGYQLLWDVPVDLEVSANATITGSYEDALNSLFASLANSEYPVEAMIYENRAVRVVKRATKEQQ